MKPPAWQCQNGHVLCDNCRGRTSRCPICRVTLGPKGRCLLAEKVFTLLAESFPCESKFILELSLVILCSYNNIIRLLFLLQMVKVSGSRENWTTKATVKPT